MQSAERRGGWNQGNGSAPPLWGRFMFLITAHFDYLPFNLFWLSYPEIDSTGNIRGFWGFFFNILKGFVRSLWHRLHVKGNNKTKISHTNNNILPAEVWIISTKALNQKTKKAPLLIASQATLKWQVSWNEATWDCWLWVKACNHHSSPVGAVLTVAGC